MPTNIAIEPMIALLEDEFGAIADVCSGLSPAEWEEPTCLPGWSVKDNLSHIVGFEASLLGEPATATEAEHQHDSSLPDHVKNPVGAANEIWVQSMRSLPGDEVLEKFCEVTQGRLAVLRAMSQDDFDKPTWTPVSPDETYGRFMRIRHFDCFMHEHDIRFAMGLSGRDDVAHVDSCLSEVETGLGYIVGKRASMPQGTTVRIDLYGSSKHRYNISVEDRARVVEEVQEPPTVTLRMPALLFLRLAGGRADKPNALSGLLECSGDPELSARLANNLAFTI